MEKYTGILLGKTRLVATSKHLSTGGLRKVKPKMIASTLSNNKILINGKTGVKLPIYKVTLQLAKSYRVLAQFNAQHKPESKIHRQVFII